MGNTMEFRVLGPLEIVRGSQPVELSAAKQRTLLAVLICHRNSPVSTNQLIDALWGPHPPRTAADNLRVYVHHLRRALGGDRIVRRQHGYAAIVAPAELDVDRFGELARRGQEIDDPHTAAAVLRQALDVWRGTPYADLTGVPALLEEARRLEEHRQTVLALRIEADLTLGRHTELIAELSRLATTYQLRERLQAQLMLALHRAGRRVEALEVFNRLRVRLADELGLDPSPSLGRLQSAILRGDPLLDDPRHGPGDIAAPRWARPACLCAGPGGGVLTFHVSGRTMIDSSSSGS
jgi:DNA-binding SARP family transcriptional activator